MTTAFGWMTLLKLLIFLIPLLKRFDVNQTPTSNDMNSFTACITPCIFADDNTNLLAPVSKAEIYKALHQVGSLKAPGPDGIHALFYHTYWYALKSSITDLVLDFSTTILLFF